MISLGVLWGMSERDKLQSFGPDHLFSEPQDMLNFLKKILIDILLVF